MARILGSIALILFSSVSAFGETVSIDITGSVGDGSSTDYTDVDGTLWNRQNSPNLPPFDIVFHDTSGDGQLYARLRITKTSGTWRNTSLEYNQVYNTQSDGYTRNYTNALQDILCWWGRPGLSGYSLADATFDGEQLTGMWSIGMRVELLDASQVVQDSIDVTINLNYDVSRQYSYNFQPSLTWTEPVVFNLYENGVLPPGGRPDSQDLGPSFNTNLTGNLTNNSGAEQTLELWADDGTGNITLFSQWTIPDGGSIPVDYGFDIGAGLSAMLVASGEVTGVGNGFVPHGSNTAIDLTFPPQEENKVRLIFDNGDTIPGEVLVGSPEAPQEFLTVPVGISEHEATYSGDLQFQGATIEQIRDLGPGVSAILLGLPVGRTPTSEIQGTATTIENGEQTETTVIQTTSGPTITVSGGSIDGGPKISPATGSVPSGITSTSSNLADEAAAQIAEIRAELEQAAAARQAAVDAVPEDALGDTTAIDTAVTDTQDFTDDALNDELPFLADIDLQAYSIGQDLTLEIPWLEGESLEINLDYPLRNIIRALIFVLFCVGYLMWMIQFFKM